MKRSLIDFINSLSIENISADRKSELTHLIQYIQNRTNETAPVRLNFICTHNSRRSQFSQLWAKVMSQYHNLDCETFSGGVEVTACNERVINTLLNHGFEIKSLNTLENPQYHIQIDQLDCGFYFSKLFDDPSNPKDQFAAVMTCAHADENCPFIPGAEERIPLRYTDPKVFDDTPEEKEGYRNKSIEIATEMYYIFSSIQ